MTIEKCCGYCNDHRTVIYGLFTEWECLNKESEFYGQEREFKETCSKWNRDGIYICAPVIRE